MEINASLHDASQKHITIQKNRKGFEIQYTDI